MTSTLVIGASELLAPLKQGVLVPAPDFLIPVPTGSSVNSGAGSGDLAFGVAGFVRDGEFYTREEAASSM